MTIFTVTLNPAIDQTITLDALVPGTVHRALTARCDAGGKGVNVAACLADWGEHVVVTGLLGTGDAGPFEALLAAKRIEDRFVRTTSSNRMNIKLIDARHTTDINMPGAPVAPDALAAVEDALKALDADHDLVILAGSLPTGCPSTVYADMTARVGERGVRVLVDTSGSALVSTLAAPLKPFCVKPNRHELAEWAGEPLDDLIDIYAAGQRLLRTGVGLVVISMGSEGALFLADGCALHAHLAAEHVHGTVGAGDAMVAGIAAGLAEQADLERLARLSTAFAVAKLGLAGANLPGRTTIEALAAAVRIDDVASAGSQT